MLDIAPSLSFSMLWRSSVLALVPLLVASRDGAIGGAASPAAVEAMVLVWRTAAPAHHVCIGSAQLRAPLAVPLEV